MRLRVVLAAVIWLAAVSPAWSLSSSVPGDQYWPPIPEPGGMANFIDTWEPDCNDGYWRQLGAMTLHADGKISYENLSAPPRATRYRVIETTPYYVVLMTWEDPWEKSPEIMRFVLLQSGDLSPRHWMDWNECRPDKKDLAGFQWTDDAAALARVWAESKSCNPKLAEPSEYKPFYGKLSWDVASCHFWRKGTFSK